MNINNLIEINDSATSDLIEFSNLIETNESKIKNSVNLIELIEAQKEDLIENNLNKINEKFVDIKVNITNNMVLLNLENFDQLIKLIVQKYLKIESLIYQNNNLINQNNNLISTTLNNQDNNLISTIFNNQNNNLISTIFNNQTNNLISTTLNNQNNILISTTLNNQNNNLISTTLNNSAHNYSFSQQIELLTTVLLKYQKENNEYLLDTEQFQQIIKLNKPKLSGFFDEMINALIPK
ncbi:hypothetical protein F8M41_001854 [Gigaspora margarita]|uniref:Uncharacterized protein n=1 Tax=Gigaspora margarita TaxID=4874 RepID=A0A8H4A7G9_GIGMA|nr:hypothetical protein F8M41_001854 [Gigaspora margarita]